jgi:hypothetical protein
MNLLAHIQVFVFFFCMPFLVGLEHKSDGPCTVFYFIRCKELFLYFG